MLYLGLVVFAQISDESELSVILVLPLSGWLATDVLKKLSLRSFLTRENGLDCDYPGRSGYCPSGPQALSGLSCTVRVKARAYRYSFAGFRVLF